MNRPISIIRFEQIYLAAVVVGTATQIANTPTINASYLARQGTYLFGHWYVPAMTAVTFVLLLVPWYFVAWRGSVGAKWVVVALAGMKLAGRVVGLLTQAYGSTMVVTLSIIGLALHLVAAWLLFRPDAIAWFKNGRAVGRTS